MPRGTCAASHCQSVTGRLRAPVPTPLREKGGPLGAAASEVVCLPSVPGTARAAMLAACARRSPTCSWVATQLPQPDGGGGGHRAGPSCSAGGVRDHCPPPVPMDTRAEVLIELGL